MGLLVAAHPLFLINGARVANDALGILLATLAIAAALRLGEGRRLLAQSALVGVLTGLAIAAKAVHFGLVPFVGVCWLLMVAANREVPKGRAALAAIALAAGCLVVIGPDLRWNLAALRLADDRPGGDQEQGGRQDDGRPRRDGTAHPLAEVTARTLAPLEHAGRRLELPGHEIPLGLAVPPPGRRRPGRLGVGRSPGGPGSGPRRSARPGRRSPAWPSASATRRRWRCTWSSRRWPGASRRRTPGTPARRPPGSWR